MSHPRIPPTPRRRRAFHFATKYTATPGGRLIIEGPWSGEDFFKRHLMPSAINGVGLDIDMTGVRGVGSSFLDQSFGEFAARYGRAVFEAYFKVSSRSYKGLAEDLELCIVDAVKG